MKRLLAAILFGFAAVVSAQTTTVWVPWSYSWVRWDGGAPTSAGSTVNCTTNNPPVWDCQGGPFSDGTIPFVWATQNANTFLAGPTSGGATIPGFRLFTLGDMPTQAANTFLMGATSGTAVPTARNLSAVADYNANKIPHTVKKFGFVQGTGSTEQIIAAVAIPAGELLDGGANDGSFVIDIYGDIKYNNVNTDTVRIRVYNGCTDLVTAGSGCSTLYDSGTFLPFGAISAIKPPYHWQITIYAQGSSTQLLDSVLFVADQNAATTGVGTPLGSVAVPKKAANQMGTTTGTAVNNANVNNVQVTVLWSVGNANDFWSVQGGRAVSYP